MLSRNRRIPRSLFSELVRSGQKTSSQYFSLTVLNSDKTRLAVSVSKKVAKKAVIRNRTRRRVYSVVRSFVSRLPNKLFLIIAKPGAEKLKGKTLESELAKLLLKR